MKLSCEKYLLQQAAQTASRATASKSAIPSLEGLLLETDSNGLYISGYDLKTGIRTHIPADVVEQGPIVLNARLFSEIIRKMPDDVVMISVDEHMSASISCALSRFHILGFSSADYPELPSIEKQNYTILEQKVLKQMIRETNFAVSDNEARPVHTGALFEIEDNTLTMVAVDGFRLALRKEAIKESSIQSFSFVVPGAALSEVERICEDSDSEVEINLGARFVQFTIGSTELISRRLEGQFLNYRSALPTNFKYELKVNVAAMAQAFDRVSLIISEKLKSPVRCCFGDGILKVSSSTALGRAQDECSIEGDGENIEIGFNNRYVLDVLRAAPTEEILVKLGSSISPAIFAPAEEGKDNFLYMVLPIRMKSSEA